MKRRFKTMVNTQIVNVKEIATILAQLKGLTASSQDGNVVGIDSVSGDNYFHTMPSLGTIYVGADGQHRIIVDAIAYDRHVGESGKQYLAANRFISVAFDNTTLNIIPGTRRNIDFDALKKRKIVAISPFEYLESLDAKVLAKKKADAERAAKLKAEQDAAKKKAELARKAVSPTAALKRFAQL